MQIIREIKNLKPIQNPISLTIGNFDGVHLGHQFLLKELTRVAKNNNGQSVVVSFENHPKSILTPHLETNLICTLTHKIKLLEIAGVDILLLLPFTKELMEQSAEYFLTTLHQLIPFRELILGHDAVFGNKREGNAENVKQVGNTLNINVRYLKPFKVGNIPISSTLIRTYIKEGNFKAFQRCLGRMYSFYGEFESFSIKCDLKGLCLPPSGIYNILIDSHIRQEFPSVILDNTKRYLKIPLACLSKNLINKLVEITLI